MNRVVRIALPIAIVAAGGLVLLFLRHTRPEPPRQDREEVGAVVDVEKAEKRAHRVEVEVSGTVTPARHVALTPEIAGRVAWVSDQLVPGGHFDEGDLVAKLDARERKLAVRQQRAEVDRARTELELERSRAAVAEREWELFAEEEVEEEGDTALARREPQLRTARAALEAAQSGLERARLNVRRSRVRAPFNAVVTERNADVGQHVAPSAPVATLVGTDEFWVRVSIPSRHLSWIDVPGVGGVEEGEGSPARVRQGEGEKETLREGRVVRLLADVDPAGRMARVLVVVEDPFGLRGEGERASPQPLLSGSYAEVEILADEVPEAVEIPRVALRDGDRVFVMNDDHRLAIRDVVVVWRDRETVLVGEGLDEGDRVVVSSVPAPSEGMKLRLEDGAEDVAAVGEADRNGAARPERAEIDGAESGAGTGTGGEGTGEARSGESRGGSDTP